MPPTALLSITFVLFGLDLQYYIAMIAVGGDAGAGADGVRGPCGGDVPEELLFKARTLGASQAEVIFDVILPAVLPRMIDARPAAGRPRAGVPDRRRVRETGAVGFGYQLRIQQRITGMNVMLLYAVLLGVFGFALDAALRVGRGPTQPLVHPMTPVLEVDGVSHAFGPTKVLHDVSFALPAGQIAALVGAVGEREVDAAAGGARDAPAGGAAWSESTANRSRGRGGTGGSSTRTTRCSRSRPRWAT